MRYYCIPARIYSSLTIGVSRRSTAVDKRRFQVRLFRASTYCAHTYCANCTSHSISRDQLRRARSYSNPLNINMLLTFHV